MYTSEGLRRQRKQISGFKARMVYKVSSGTARAKQTKRVSKSKKEKKKAKATFISKFTPNISFNRHWYYIENNQLYCCCVSGTKRNGWNPHRLTYKAKTFWTKRNIKVDPVWPPQIEIHKGSVKASQSWLSAWLYLEWTTIQKQRTHLWETFYLV